LRTLDSGAEWIMMSYIMSYNISINRKPVDTEEEAMARYSLNLPTLLKQEAEVWATNQGISLNQFILWAVAEKVGALNQRLDDPAFPNITYRRGASGEPMAVLRGTGLRVQTVVVAAQAWGLSSSQIATEFELSEPQVHEALAFYDAHRHAIDATIATEHTLEAEAHG